MYIPEILAPVGSKESFFAALYAGADAVYLGLSAYNARIGADNFSINNVGEYVYLAHKYKMKVYITLNISLKNNEIKDLGVWLFKLELLQVDAIIVQDIGLAIYINKFFPQLIIHASTQMAVHNIHYLPYLYELNIKRVVLARELSINEINFFVKEALKFNIEVEIFCHGSLCYSYSGLCLWGGITLNRSGNRGECCYPCRFDYEYVNKKVFYFSMKDLHTLNILPELMQVHSLKIEGRKKDALYVATTVYKYREKLNEIFNIDTLQNRIKAVNFLDKVPDNEKLYMSNFSFQRKQTNLYLQAITCEVKQNVVDTQISTHNGVIIGFILNIYEIDNQKYIKFITTTDLYLHDGIKINDIEFSVKKILVANKSVVQVLSNTEILLQVPYSVFYKKDVIYKTRSDLLNKAIKKIITLQNNDKLLNYFPVKLFFEYDNEFIIIKCYYAFDKEFVYKYNIDKLKYDKFSIKSIKYKILEEFYMFGNFNFYSQNIVFDINIFWETYLCFNHTQIKEMKKEFAFAFINYMNKQQIVDDFINSPKLDNYYEIDNKTTFEIKTYDLDIINYFNKLNANLSYSLSCLNYLNDLEKLKKLDDYQNISNLTILFPPIIREYEFDAYDKLLILLKNKKIYKYKICNISQLILLKKYYNMNELNISIDYHANVWNDIYINYLIDKNIKQICISPELTKENIMQLQANRQYIQIFIYGYPLVSISEACHNMVLNHDNTSLYTSKNSIWLKKYNCRNFLYTKSCVNNIHHLCDYIQAGFSHFLLDLPNLNICKKNDFELIKQLIL